MAERKAVTKQMAKRYKRTTKAEKGSILDELCAPTGRTRRHARRALSQALKGKPQALRRAKPKMYGPEVLEPLRFVWATLNAPAGKRLAPFMAEAVEEVEFQDPSTLFSLARVSNKALSVVGEGFEPP
jgi:hypothetical protein